MKKIMILSAAIFVAAGTTVWAADGAAVYKKNCASCHGADGSGNTKMGKKLKCRDLTDAAVQAKISDAAIAKSITDGISRDGKVVMKPIKLDAADIAAVTKYVRGLKK
jgi:mono/diheme cytochrome c family protein